MKVKTKSLAGITKPQEIFETRLLLNQKCHWSACSYCGINAKYPCMDEDHKDKVEDVLSWMSRVEEKGYKLLVSLDEAIPVEFSYQLAKEKIIQKNALPWHYRSKIDTGYNDEVLSTLAKSGLKGIYFGLESINERVLALMNKYPKPIQRDFIMDLTKRMFSHGIHCHYCVIIGFPGESNEEFYETLDFIRMLKKENPAMTFTINIFDLDISSTLFREMDTINEIHFPFPMDSFIGNLLPYHDQSRTEELLRIKRRFLADCMDHYKPGIFEWIENPNSLINYIKT